MTPSKLASLRIVDVLPRRQLGKHIVLCGVHVGDLNDPEAQEPVVRQVGERIWLVTFMQYDLGYFDDETCRLEPIENPLGSKVLPMCSE